MVGEEESAGAKETRERKKCPYWIRNRGRERLEGSEKVKTERERVTSEFSSLTEE